MIKKIMLVILLLFLGGIIGAVVAASYYEERIVSYKEKIAEYQTKIEQLDLAKKCPNCDVNLDGFVNDTDLNIIKSLQGRVYNASEPDFNHDGRINKLDLIFLRSDVNRDGVVSIADLSIVKSIIDGQMIRYPPSTTVPCGPDLEYRCDMNADYLGIRISPPADINEDAGVLPRDLS